MNERPDTDSGTSPASERRREAERRWRQQQATGLDVVAELDARALLHELQVHQIELEMQNEELLRARAAAEEASEKYSDLFDFAPVGYFLWDQEGQIRAVNLAGAALLGLDRSQVVQTRFGQFVAPEDRARFADFCRRVWLAEGQQTCEVKLLRDGLAVDVLVEGLATADHHEPGRLCRAAVVDIRFQKRAAELAAANQALHDEIASRLAAEKEARDAEERLRRVLQASATGTFEVDLATGEGQWNAVEFALLGLRVGEAPAHPETFFRYVHPDDVGPLRERWEAARQIGELNAEFRIVRADGVERWLAAKGGFVFEDAEAAPGRGARGQAARFLGVNFDITERKRDEEALRESEERLRLHVENTPLAVIEWGPDFRLSRWSAEAERLFGWRAAEVLGKRMDEFRWIYDEDFAQVSQKVSASWLDGTCLRNVNRNRNYRKDGSIVYCEWYNSSLLDESGRLRSILSLVLDVTERERAEAALRKSEALLARAQRVANLGSWEWDIVTGELTWSDQTYRIFGLPPGAITPSYEAFLAMIHPEDRRQMKQAVEDALAGQPYRVEYHVRQPDAGIRHILAQGDVDFDPAGKPLRMVGTALDITERKLAEQQLAESHQRLEAVMRAVPVGVSFSDDATCQWITGNPAVLAQFQVQPEDNLSASAPDHEAPGRQVHFYREGRLISDVELPLQQAVADNREIPSMELEVVMPDGRRWFADASAAPIRDALGQVIGGVAVTVDITRRKRAEEEIAKLNQDLQRRVTELQTIFETAPLGLAITEDAAGHRIRGNPANERLLGVGPGGELSKGGPRAARYRCVQGGRELAVTELPMQRAVRGEVVTGQVLEVLREDEQRLTLYSSAAPLFDEHGQPRGAVGAFLDITSLKRAEARTALLSDITAQLLASDQPQRIVEVLCRRVMEHLGCQAFFNFLVDEPAGRLHLNACAGIPEEAARQIEWLEYGVAVCGCAARDGCRIVAEHIQTTPDPRTELIRSFGLQAYACHPLQAQGQVLGTLSFGSRSKAAFTADELGLMKAVADHVAIAMQRVRLLESSERHARAAEAANVAKSQFLANMSHELRTPMNAILGMIDVALPKAKEPQVRDCLQTAKDSADLLLTLLNDLLDSAKIESGKLELEAAPFSLRQMLGQIARTMSVRASEKSLNFSCRMLPGTPETLLGDRMRLQQILLNLAGNALKFTERGEVEISVRALAEDGAAGLEFAVRDTGIGIPSAHLEQIFQPFAQADVSTTRRFGGTGLGLSICKNLVELMGGRIWIASQVGQGSTFYFTVHLPLAQTPPADSGTPVAVPPAACVPLRILLVEDNPANQKVATYVLQERGHRVEIAGDGRLAVALTAQNAYDVVLMDIQMPNMNGLEAAAAIRQRESLAEQETDPLCRNGPTGGAHNRNSFPLPPRVPIIAMTAYASKADRLRCLAAGMDAYLSKPIDGPELIALVETFAARSPAAAAATPGTRCRAAGGRDRLRPRLGASAVREQAPPGRRNGPVFLCRHGQAVAASAGSARPR